MKKLFLLVILIMTLISCRDSGTAQWSALGKDSKIELLNADGSITHSWISSGKVATEDGSDGYYFMDDATGKLVRISGDVIITVADKTTSVTTITN